MENDLSEMNTNMKPAVMVMLFVLTLCFVDRVYCQDPRPSPAPPEPDFWRQEEMTGDWGGARKSWKEKGIELEFKLTHFYQAVTSGGVREDEEYNGKFESTWKFDLAKVAGWKWWSSQIKTEYRFGGPVLLGTGGINPVNTATLTPDLDGGVVSITAVNFTRLIPKDLAKGNLWAISFGRFNVLDLLQEDFFAGTGVDRFFNIADNGPLTVLREVPLVTNGVTFATVKGGEPIFTFAVLDPNDHSRDPGIEDLFADGVTFMPGYNIPTKYGGKSGKHTSAARSQPRNTLPSIRSGKSLFPVHPQTQWNRSGVHGRSVMCSDNISLKEAGKMVGEFSHS